jgi:hypothetical protein
MCSYVASGAIISRHIDNSDGIAPPVVVRGVGAYSNWNSITPICERPSGGLGLSGGSTSDWVLNASTNVICSAMFNTFIKRDAFAWHSLNVGHLVGEAYFGVTITVVAMTGLLLVGALVGVSAVRVVVVKGRLLGVVQEAPENQSNALVTSK